VVTDISTVKDGFFILHQNTLRI